MQTGPNIQVEEMRTYVFQALRYFKSQSNNTSNYPDLKKIDNLQRWIEEMIFRSHSADFVSYGHSEPDKRMNENNRHQFLNCALSIHRRGNYLGECF